MTRSIGKWKLPQPTDIKEENEWVPIPRIARTVPFGYKQDDEDPDILQPIQIELDEKASRNWEGIVRLDDRGFLVATDKYPEMILGFIPFK